MGRMRGKSVVIVGGTSGLGFSAAKALAREGANLVLVGRNPETAQSAAEALKAFPVRTVIGDAADPEVTDQAVAECVHAFGRLDGLYHVAGGSGRRFGDGPLHEVTDEGIAATIRLNLEGLIVSNRSAVRQLLAQGEGGSILNMGSVLGFSPSPKFFTTHVYAATKAAAIGLTTSCAASYAKDNIRFNLIAPALVETPMSQRAMGNAEILAFSRSKQPLEGGRHGIPEDLDDAVVFFLSDGSRFVTGQVLAVDGGWSVTEGQHGS